MIPKGSDGVVDFDSMIAQGPRQPMPSNAYTLEPWRLVSHSKPLSFFDSAVGQVDSLAVAQHVRRALRDDFPLGDENVTFGPFVMPTRLTEGERKQI